MRDTDTTTNRRVVLAGLAGLATAAIAARPRPVRAAGAKLTVSSYSLPFAEMQVGGVPVLALVDTGSVRGIQLSERLAARVGITLEEEGGRNRRYTGGGKPILAGRAGGVVLGDWRGDEPVNVIPGDITEIAEQVDTAFDAILGWRFLSRFDFRLDYAGRRLVLVEEDALSAALNAALALPLDPGKSLPVTAGTLDGRATAFLVDTGAPLCNLDVPLAAAPRSGELERHAVVVGGRAMAVDFRVKDLAAIRQGLGCEAVIGHPVLAAAGRMLHRRANRAFLLAD